MIAKRLTIRPPTFRWAEGRMEPNVRSWSRIDPPYTPPASSAHSAGFLPDPLFLRPKSPPKSPSNFDSFLVSFLGRFGLHFWAQKASKTPRETTSENDPKRKAQKREIELPLNVFCRFSGPTWSQNGPKNDQNVSQKAPKNWIRKLMPEMQKK